MPRKPARGRFSVVVPLEHGATYRVETVKDVSRTPEQLVSDLRVYADVIERLFVKRDK